MIKFNKPEKLNGSQLVDELKAQNIKISQPPMIDENNDLLLDISQKDEITAKAIVKTHIGVDNYVTDEKLALLAKLGITQEEAKLLLS